jgi:hypothetical protein
MAIFTVFDRPGRVDEAPRVVQDGFSWFAFLLPPFYAIVHRMWWSLAGYLVILAGIIASSFVIGDEAARAMYLFFALWIGFEASSMRRRSLLSKGFLFRADLVAIDADLAAVEWLKARDRAA